MRSKGNHVKCKNDDNKDYPDEPIQILYKAEDFIDCWIVINNLAYCEHKHLTSFRVNTDNVRFATTSSIETESHGTGLAIFNHYNKQQISTQLRMVIEILPKSASKYTPIKSNTLHFGGCTRREAIKSQLRLHMEIEVAEIKLQRIHHTTKISRICLKIIVLR